MPHDNGAARDWVWNRLPSAPQVVEKLRRRVEAGDEQGVAGAGAGDIQQVAFGVVDLLEVGTVCHRLYPPLQRHHLIVARHDGEGPELEALGPVHHSNRGGGAGCLAEILLQFED